MTDTVCKQEMALGSELADAIAIGATRQLRKLGLSRKNVDEIVRFGSNASCVKDNH